MLDGRVVSAPAGLTLLETCRANGVAVPTLCHVEGLPPVATCRLCVVEVRGADRPVPACATQVRDGMVVSTASERIQARRRATVELLLANGDHVCSICRADGRCQLQRLARDLGVDDFDPRPRPFPPPDRSRAGLAYDRGKCVLCTRCVRICARVERAAALTVLGRGRSIRIAMAGAARWADGRGCTDCGRCVAGCPTGALFSEARPEPWGDPDL